MGFGMMVFLLYFPVVFKISATTTCYFHSMREWSTAFCLHLLCHLGHFLLWLITNTDPTKVNGGLFCHRQVGFRYNWVWGSGLELPMATLSSPGRCPFRCGSIFRQMPPHGHIIVLVALDLYLTNFSCSGNNYLLIPGKMSFVSHWLRPTRKPMLWQGR